MKKLKLLTLSLLISLTSFSGVGAAAAGVSGTVPPVAYLADTKGAACAGLDQIDSSQGCSSQGGGVNKLVGAVVNIISIIAGIAAVIMIIISGFRYITSGGDSAKVGSAKGALIYALVGVAVVVLAQFLVHFVINTTQAAAK